MRDNYWSARLTNEIIYLQTCVRARAHRLLLNTLPAPIVQQIAQGTVSKVSRYEGVAVLQCDLVGFTQLSQDHTPTSASASASA
jgi:class 3 adenylate cyclase